MNRSLVFDLATCTFIEKREDALFLGPGGTGKSRRADRVVAQARRPHRRRAFLLLNPHGILNMPTTCHRCSASTTVATMSKFKTDTICMSREQDERLAPGYREACHAESVAILRRLQFPPNRIVIG